MGWDEGAAGTEGGKALTSLQLSWKEDRNGNSRAYLVVARKPTVYVM